MVIADPLQDRPDIVAATRGGDNSLGMEHEADPTTAALDVALFWRGIYTDIVKVEEAVLARIRQLKATQSPEVQREIELTNLPVVESQVLRFRSRRTLWDDRVRAHAGSPLLRPLL